MVENPQLLGEGERVWAYALLNGFSDPVILVDGERRTVFANTAAGSVMDITTVGRDLAISFRHPSALEAVDEVLETGIEKLVDVLIAAPIQRTFQLHTRRVKFSTAEQGGVMIVMRDVTAMKSADQMRRDFVANVSHELRSPISSLVGIIETLRESAKADPDSQKRFLEIMAEEAARMSRLIDDLLSLSRVEVSEHMPPDKCVDISSILENTIELLQGRATENLMAIQLSTAASLPDIPGDADELTEVFENLIDNAIKYGDSKSDIKISIVQIDRIPELNIPCLAIYVKNKGDGIPAEHLPRLTERFYRADKGRSRVTGGTGLGLAIVKHIVNRHRGRLSIESSPGETTTFTVYLPLFNGGRRSN